MIILSPKQQSIEKVSQSPLLQPFSGTVLAFLTALSRRLLRHPQRNSFAEIAALGFWLRESQLKKIQQSIPEKPEVLHKSLGTVVHYTPANVDTMFIYSWVCSLLMGNRNIIRLSTRHSETKSILLAELNVLFEQVEFKSVADTNIFVSFSHDDPVSESISRLADARVIWGGDETVIRIRLLPSKARCRDIAFADRFSAALINTDMLNDDSDFEMLATKLWRDTQPYGQMACSSPRLLLTLGDDYYSKSQKLARYLSELAKQNEADPAKATNHLVTTQLLQSCGASGQALYQGDVTLLQIDNLNQQLLDWHCGQGVFYLIAIKEARDLIQVANDKLQTLSYWGLDKQVIFKIIENEPIRGIDRVVPVGQALDFSHYWDGYELLTQLSKTVTTV